MLDTPKALQESIARCTSIRSSLQIPKAHPGRTSEVEGRLAIL